MPSTDRPALVLMVLLDALRHDAVSGWAEALRSRGFGVVSGAVRENFGFQTRPAYFAGLHPETAGMVTMMVHGPESSPFSMLRHVPGPLLRLADASPLVSRIVRGFLGKRLRQLGDAVGLYGSTLDIPLDRLHLFDFAEKSLPWTEYGGHPTVFSLLSERKSPYLYLGYPFIRDYTSDKATVTQLLRQLEPDVRFVFVQLTALDGAGHLYGPDSLAYARGVERYAELLGEIIDGCRAVVGDNLHVLAFGDHGMVAVHQRVDVAAAFGSLPDATRRNCTPFYDSTLARFWCTACQAKEALAERLAALPGGRLLTDADLERFRIRLPDNVLGHLTWFADPGVLVYPNDFSRTSRPPQGMHGYDPACTDNLGALLVATTGGADGTVGTVDQVDLFPTALQLLGIPVPAESEGMSVLVPSRLDEA